MQAYGDGVELHSAAGGGGRGGGGGGTWEIEEVASGDGPSESRGGLPLGGLGEQRHAGEDVYVAVGKRGSSMDALAWALNQKPSGFVYLVHVFPEVHQIPTPLGMLPKIQVSPQQVASHMSQERSKRRELLHKYMNFCHGSKVQVDVLLIESDLLAKAILELIPVLHIRRLIMGTSKSNLRLIRKGGGKIGQVLMDAPEYCEVKIICEGQEVRTTADEVPSPPSPLSIKEDSRGGKSLKEDQNSDMAMCKCFSRKFM